jgi:Zn-dependent protease
MTVHEYSHGWVAYKLGDTTAKYSGRLTLNPLAHIDPVWTFLLPLFLFVSSGGRFIFGAAKPVPINYWALKNPKRDIIWVGASGPLSNLLLAVLLSVFIRIPLPEVVHFVIINLIVINIVLGVFNLVPIPPLDGSRILMGLLPGRLATQYASIEPFGFIILMVLIWMGVFGNMIWPIVELILKILGLSSQ